MCPKGMTGSKGSFSASGNPTHRELASLRSGAMRIGEVILAPPYHYH
jgi:hypothetical protein